MKKLAIITTHPIQYNAPWFAMLSKRKRLELKVFYTWQNAEKKFFDPDFKQQLEWDIPLLDGYEYEFVKNTASVQSSKSYYGIQNPDLNKRILLYKPDAILVFGWKLKSHLSAMKYFKGKIPVLFRGDSTLLDENGSGKDKIRRIILGHVFKNIDVALYVGMQNKNYFQNNGLKDYQLVYVPHAIDNKRFMDLPQSGTTQLEKWKRQLGIEKKKPVFLFVGKFEHKKNPLILSEAAKVLKTKSFRILFVGGGELEELLKKESDLFAHLQILPFQNQSLMPLVYRLGDVLVLPSKGPGETWGLAVNEAMACGLPVIVSDKVGCADDLVENNFNGFIFKSGDVSQLAEKMLFFIENKDKIIQMGLASRDKIDFWSFEQICDAVERTMENLPQIKSKKVTRNESA